MGLLRLRDFTRKHKFPLVNLSAHVCSFNNKLSSTQATLCFYTFTWLPRKTLMCTQMWFKWFNLLGYLHQYRKYECETKQHRFSNDSNFFPVSLSLLMGCNLHCWILCSSVMSLCVKQKIVYHSDSQLSSSSSMFSSDWDSKRLFPETKLWMASETV